jgi:hypothetical protein
MEDICILCNVVNLTKKSDQGRNMKALWPFQASNGIGTIVQKYIDMFVYVTKYFNCSGEELIGGV